MANSEQHSESKRQTRNMFNRIAPSYDRINTILSFGADKRWRKRFVAMAAEQAPSTILDMATGTGEVAVALAHKLPECKITGADLSKQMLAEAVLKIEQQGLGDRITLVEADVEQLPWADESFDLTTVAFGVRNFPSQAKALGELYRTLRSGGELLVVEFSEPRNRLFGAIYRLYRRYWMPWLGGLLSGDRNAYTYLPASIAKYCATVDFRAELTKAGFRLHRDTRLTGGIATIYRATKPTKTDN